MRITRRDQNAFLLGHDPSPSAATGRALDAMGIAAGAALTGLAAGRLNHWNIPNTPLPLGLTVGVALHALDLFKVTPPWMSRHVGNVANGAIASWATLVGAGYGQQMLAKAGEPPNLAAGVGCAPRMTAPSLPRSPVMSGREPVRQPLTEAELAGISHRHR